MLNAILIIAMFIGPLSALVAFWLGFHFAWRAYRRLPPPELLPSKLLKVVDDEESDNPQKPRERIRA